MPTLPTAPSLPPIDSPRFAGVSPQLKCAQVCSRALPCVQVGRQRETGFCVFASDSPLSIISFF